MIIEQDLDGSTRFLLNEPAIVLVFPLEGEMRASWPQDRGALARILADLDAPMRELLYAAMETTDGDAR